MALIPLFLMRLNSTRVVLIRLQKSLEAFAIHFLQQEGMPSKEDQEKKAQHVADMKNSILSQVLDQSARARCENFLYK